MAKDTNWLGGATGATTNWEHPDNWSNGQPDDGDSVYGLEDITYGMLVNVDRTRDNGTAATGTLTLAANAGNGETVTLGDKTYTFQTVLTDVDGNVLIGATASDSLDNLIAAINLSSGGGSTYAASTTINVQATAAAGVGDTMDVTARQKNIDGNSVASTETMANGSWGGATLSGGVDGNGLNLALFDIHNYRKFHIGSSGTPLKMTADQMHVRGPGDFYFTSARSGGANLTDRMIIETVRGDGETVITDDGSASFTLVEFMSGNITFTPSTAGGRVFVAYIERRDFDVNLVYQPSANVGYLYISGGQIDLDASAQITDMRVSGGVVDYNSTNNVVRLHQTGGVVKDNQPTDNGLIAEAIIERGTFTTMETGAQKTVTNLFIGPGATVLYDSNRLAYEYKYTLGEL